MKLGLGLYRHMLTTENFRFAKQAGATHIVAHLTNYFNTPESLSTGSGGAVWGVTQNHEQLWTYEELRDLRQAIEAEGLALEAIENFDPSHWYDVLLDGSQKQAQLEGIKTMIRNMGRAGIPIMGYYFSLAGAWGRIEIPTARGQAMGVGYVAERAPEQSPIPNGTIWNMTYDMNAAPGNVPIPTRDEMWQRLQDFLEAIIPVAAEAGVRLAAHPDDPPLPELRGTPRLLHDPEHFDQLLNLVPSEHNALEFCLGTITEMPNVNIYEEVEKYSRAKNIGYIHFRNVRGKVPNYAEVFVDEGDTDMLRVMRILYENGYDGVLIPDHTPQMACDAPWHAGMAYALGYMKAALQLMTR